LIIEKGVKIYTGLIYMKMLVKEEGRMKLIIKKNFVLLVFAISLFIVGSSAFAQGKPGAGRGKPPSMPSASEIVSRMKEILNLTDQQVVQVTTIIQEEISQMGSLMKSGNPEANRSKMESIRQQTESKLSKVLTSEQLTKWKNSKPQNPQGGENKSSGRSSGFDSNSNSFNRDSSSSTSGSSLLIK